MSPRPLKIVIPRLFASNYEAQLTVPHVLVPFGGENDAAMAALLSDADVLVNGAYRPARKPTAGAPLRLIHSTGVGVDGIDFPSVPAGCTAGQTQRPARLSFHELDNIIMTPHKPTAETMAYRWRAIAGNIARLAAGEPLLRVVHP